MGSTGASAVVDLGGFSKVLKKRCQLMGFQDSFLVIAAAGETNSARILCEFGLGCSLGCGLI
jgi:hypothetical protein